MAEPWESAPIIQPAAPRAAAKPAARPNPLLDKIVAGTDATRASTVSSQLNAAKTSAEIPFIAAEKQADIAAKQASTDAVRAKLAAKDAEKDAAAEAKRMGAISLREKTEEMLSSLREARRLAKGNTTGLAGQLLSGIGGTEAKDLSGYIGPTGSISAQVMLGAMQELKKLSPTGATGLGAMSNSEGAALRNSIASLDQARSEKAVEESLATIEKHFRRFYAIANRENPNEPKVAAKYGIIIPPKKGEKPQPPSGGVTGKFDTIEHPELRGINSSVGAMLRSGVPATDVRAYLNKIQPTLGDRAENLEWYEDFYRQNPKSRENPRIDLERTYVPKEGIAKTVGEVAESPLGAAVIGGTDVLTGGFLDEATKNPELTRAVMSGVQEENPKAYFGGQLGGGLLGAAIPATLAARYGVGVGPKALAAIEGGVYGTGSADSDDISDRMVGGATGAALGAVGQKVLGGLTRAGGSAIAGLTDKYTKLLSDKGVPLTLGEMIGGKAAASEQKFGQIPGFGGGVKARQRESMEGFNAAAFDDTLAPIGGSTNGEVAEKGIQSAKDQIGQFYDKTVGGKQFVPDEEFVVNVDGLRNSIAELPDVGPLVSRDINKSVGDLLNPDRPMTGEEWQAGLRSLKAIGSKYKKNPYSANINEHITGLLGEMEGLAVRNVPEIAEDLSAANQAYRKYSVLKDAVRANAKDSESLFTPEQLMTASAANAERFGVRGASAEGTHPFFDLAKAGINVLTPASKSSAVTPYVLPASVMGTMAGVNYALQPTNRDPTTGEISGRDPTLAALIGGSAGLLAATPYSKVAQKYLQKGLMGDRSPGTKAVGEFFRDKASRVAGGLATAPLYDKYMGHLPRAPQGEDEQMPGLPAMDPSFYMEEAVQGPSGQSLEIDEEGFVTMPDGSRRQVLQP